MANYKKLTFVFFLTTLTIFTFIFFKGNPMNYKAIEQDVLTYLIEDRGYQEKDILKIKGSFNPYPIRFYTAHVWFSDEPDARYVYIYVQDMYKKGYYPEGQKLAQFSSGGTKHIEGNPR